ncbi:hypothetical protein GTQ43_39840 [Nostoc sp. KVJ3]|uniref:effector-associated domain EAD1-containing protein n=1 Tax=Nostoc sp. KVJ3 TaxID=457945 RepID=UPI00223861D5|nr:effector-associated domain EAD1-containing protein [Nostoc sp. KVJ3]MCW5319486.1 hypothetical protein [Nostoc sp. KVJ3]
MTFSGQQRRQLKEALISAFPTRSSLEQMLSLELEKNLEAIAGGSNLQDIVFRLIQMAEAEGWLNDLIHAAQNYNPGNQALRDFTEAYITSNSDSLTADYSVTVRLRELLSNLVNKLIAIPAADSFQGRTAFLLNIQNSDSLNRSNVNARTDISLIVQQLRERGNQFSAEHPLYILIDNAFQYANGYGLGEDLVSLRDQINVAFEELYNDEH